MVASAVRTTSTARLRLVSADSADPQVSAELFAGGGEPSLEQLYERYAAYVGALASRMLGRVVEVDDVVQDVFASAATGLRRRDNEQEVRGWFAKVTVRRCMRQLRVRALWRIVSLDEDPSYDRLAVPDASADERQLIAEVYRALDALPARQRIPWALHHIEGEGLPRVAELCDCSLATVKRRIAEARERLAFKLREHRHA